ncbi:Phosphate transporter [Plasmodiophora brassicae]
MLVLLALSGVVALCMAWAIGAQDVSNALGTAVGSKAITVRQAILIGAVCEFSGALLGGDVATTISKGIIAPDEAGSAFTYCLVMFCTLAGAFLWLLIATIYALPVSTSHSMIGSLVGLGLVVCPSALNVGILSTIVVSWVVSPLLGAVIAYAVFSTIHRGILMDPRPTRAASIMIPYFWAFTLSTLTGFLTAAGPAVLRLKPAACLVASLVVFVLVVALAKMQPGNSAGSLFELVGPGPDPIASDAASPVEACEAMFIRLMIVTACVVSFAHGSNDVSNSIGPFAAIVEVFTTGSANGMDPVPLWILVAGGLGIVLGLGTYGYKVMATIGERITRLTYSRGFAAQLATALTVLTASILGISVSTTHCLIGAITGLALVEGADKVNKQTLKKIAMSWVVTLPASAAFSLIVLTFARLFV